MSVGGPPPAPPKGATPEQMLEAQNASQAYWFAINAKANQQKQDGDSQSNLQKTIAASADEHIRNLKVG